MIRERDTPYRGPLSHGARRLLTAYAHAADNGTGEPPGDGRHVNALLNAQLISDDPPGHRVITVWGIEYLTPGNTALNVGREAA